MTRWYVAGGLVGFIVVLAARLLWLPAVARNDAILMASPSVLSSPTPETVSPSRSGIAGWYEAEGYTVTLPGWQDGTLPYDVQVCAADRGKINCLILTATGKCECPRGHIADIAAPAFYALLPLDRDAAWVQIDGIK